jgi:ATP-binding cassette subfamily F protein 3
MQFGGDFLFRDATFTIRPGDRMGLVGPNGAGKTTLLRIIAGVYPPESGSINKPSGYQIGYLPQEPKLDNEAQSRSVIDEALRAREDLLSIEMELAEIQVKLEIATDHESEDYSKLLDRFGTLHHQFEDGGGFTYKSEVEKVLTGLGFELAQLTRPVATFSGGWQMRLFLAKLLLGRPEALLLDEPTNHLDLESMIWLEDYLRSFQGIILMVSHDRAFLNAITNRIAEIEKGSRIDVYTGNYDQYETTKAEREAQLVARAANLDARRKELESFVERFRYKATKARQAQSRLKMLERMERIELASHGSAVHFSFPAAAPSGRMVFEVERGAKSYDGKHNIFQDVELRIERGDRVAFLGKNGEGKTTLAKIFAGQENLTGGELKPTHNVTIGYYAQHQADALDQSKTVLETVEEVSRAQFFHQAVTSTTPRTQGQLRSLLGAFLFHGDDVFKPVKVLSGGEKSRLALAKMLLEPINTLILDEPTNHLDMNSKEVVKEALLQFEGTVIVVSHDRDFLEDLCDRLITFQNGEVKETLKPLEEYLRELHERELTRIQDKRANKQKAAAREQAKADSAGQGSKKSSEQGARKSSGSNAKAASATPAASAQRTPTDSKDRKRVEAAERNARYQKEKPLRTKLEKIEKDIEKLEKEKTWIEDSMMAPHYYSDAERIVVDAERIQIIRKRLESLFFEWATLSEEIEKIGA